MIKRLFTPERLLMILLSNANPVLRAELKHQQYVIANSRAGRFWIGLALVLLIPALLASLLFLAEAFTGANIWYTLTDQTRSPVVGVLLIMNLALYIVVTLITMGLAADSIAREQTNHTWESLLLTTLHARQIVWGKWWATLRALWGDQLMLVLLRWGLAAFLASQITHHYHNLPQVDRLYLLVTLALVTAYTLVEAGFSAALGMIAPLSRLDGLFAAVLVARLLATAGVMALIYLCSLWMHSLIAGFIGLAAAAALLLLALLAAEWIARATLR